MVEGGCIIVFVGGRRKNIECAEIECAALSMMSMAITGGSHGPRHSICSLRGRLLIVRNEAPTQSEGVNLRDGIEDKDASC